MKYSLLPKSGVLAALFFMLAFVTTAQSAPFGPVNSPDRMMSTNSASALLQPVHYRRCQTRLVRRCRVRSVRRCVRWRRGHCVRRKWRRVLRCRWVPRTYCRRRGLIIRVW